MAHNINRNQKTGKDSVFTVKEKAWHGLGQTVEHALTSEEAIKEAGLDYVVEKRKIYISKPTIEVPNKFATVRTDTNQPLGVVGTRYTVLQNTEAFKFFDAIVGNKEAMFTSGGALGDGETVWISAKLPDYIKVGKEDIEKFLLLTNTHNGFDPVQALFTPISVVCNNTLTAALSGQPNRIRIRHTSSVEARVQEAHKLMGIVNLYANELGEIFNVMAKAPIVDKKLKEFIINVFATDAHQEKLAKGEEMSTKFDNLVDSVLEYAHSHDTQQIATRKGTIFGAYNAITGYFQNVKEYKNQEDKMTSILGEYGSGKRYSQKAFELAYAMVKN